uniref:Tripartite motif-containing 14 n=1 Tax=Xenopus tropicalis TaxID=8364 RepID=A0A803JMJ2_XENTR
MSRRGKAAAPMGAFHVPAEALASGANQSYPPPVGTCTLCRSPCPVPVLMVNCGHRFCLRCLENFWQRLPNLERPCPTCTTQGVQRPSVPPPAICDVCPAHAPCAARWSCLTCGESYCPEHFQPHIGEEGGRDLSGHQVCDADGEEACRMREVMGRSRRCPEHRERTVELYCRVCKVCICTLCPLLGTHRTHPVTLIQEEARLEKEYTSAEKDMQRHMCPAEQLHPVPVTYEHIENYFSSFVEAYKSFFKKPLAKRLKNNVFSSLSVNSSENPRTMIKTKSFEDRSLFLKHARCPTLDPDTMHPRLRLLEDRLTVYCAWIGRFNSGHPQRFDKLLQVMSRDCFRSGSHYWEIDLLQAGQGWWIGVTYPSIQRKGDTEFSRLGWNSGSWCIKRYAHEYWAFHKGERTPILLQFPPERVGVFLDYEAGVLSFFDVTSGMRLLHTFRCRFTEPVYPALRLWDGTITMSRLN